MSPGGPQSMLLERWAQWIADAFGVKPYLVGSSVGRKDWRDIDVRLMLDDEQWQHWIGDARQPYRCDPRWSLLCSALSAHGSQQTGLPIDFQIQRISEANEMYPHEPRLPLFQFAPSEPLHG